VAVVTGCDKPPASKHGLAEALPGMDLPAVTRWRPSRAANVSRLRHEETTGPAWRSRALQPGRDRLFDLPHRRAPPSDGQGRRGPLRAAVVVGGLAVVVTNWAPARSESSRNRGNTPGKNGRRPITLASCEFQANGRAIKRMFWGLWLPGNRRQSAESRAALPCTTATLRPQIRQCRPAGNCWRRPQ